MWQGDSTIEASQGERMVAGVMEAVVFEVEYPRWGQQVSALITTDHHEQSREATVAARVSLPRQVMVMDTLPRTANGKIARARATERWLVLRPNLDPS